MRKRKNFRKRPKDNSEGLQVKVFNNNVDEALKRLKRKVKKLWYVTRIEKKRILHQTIGYQKRKKKSYKIKK